MIIYPKHTKNEGRDEMKHIASLKLNTPQRSFF
jgi:hypothetical protein